eukprot:SAG11_NODE_675_length_7800_cov_6.380730_2_plen_172_part_00
MQSVARTWCLLQLLSNQILATIPRPFHHQVTARSSRFGREVRWYTSGGSKGQFQEERDHASGIFSCCTGFAIYPNASFRCPDAQFWEKTTAPFIDNYTVDHTISVCRGCDTPGGAKRVPFNWTAAQASIPAMVKCANEGNITGFLIDWEPPSYRVRSAEAASESRLHLLHL